MTPEMLFKIYIWRLNFSQMYVKWDQYPAFPTPPLIKFKRIILQQLKKETASHFRSTINMVISQSYLMKMLLTKARHWMFLSEIKYILFYLNKFHPDQQELALNLKLNIWITTSFMSTNILLQMYVKYQVLGLKTFTIMICFH